MDSSGFQDHGQLHLSAPWTVPFLEPSGTNIIQEGGRLSLSEPWAVTILQGNLTITYFGNNGRFRLSELRTLQSFRTMANSIFWNHGQFHNSDPGTVPSLDQQTGPIIQSYNTSLFQHHGQLQSFRKKWTVTYFGHNGQFSPSEPQTIPSFRTLDSTKLQDQGHLHNAGMQTLSSFRTLDSHTIQDHRQFHHSISRTNRI